MSSIFKDLENDVIRGMNGDVNVIPVGLGKANEFISFRQRMFTILFSSSGAGKTSLFMSMLLNAIDWCILNDNQNFKCILFSMERSSKYQIAKWIIRRVFKETGTSIYLSKLLGWGDIKLTEEEFDLFKNYEPYVDEILNKYVILHEGAKTPQEIESIIQAYADENGTYNTIDSNLVYTPNNPNMITVIAIDHGNITKRGKEHTSKKQAIDDLVAKLQAFRDVEGFSPFWISQINRTLSGTINGKEGDQEPIVDHIKESSDIADAADLIMSLFDPYKFKQNSKTGYNVAEFIDKKNGANYFRSIQILKNSYGSDNIRFPLAFNGFCSDFKILPKRSDLSDYECAELIKTVLEKSYFLND